MKKTSKLFGAIALSAALAMGTAVPAFAAVTPDGTGNIPSKEGDTTDLTVGDDMTKDTVVTVSTHTSQISVTIPVALPVVADTAGGYGMSPNNYKITNNSVPDIEIDSASWKIVDGAKAKWNLNEEAYTSMGGEPVEITTNDGVTKAIAPTMGTLFMSLTPGEFTPEADDEDTGAGTWEDKDGAVTLNISSSGEGKKLLTQQGSQDGLKWVITGSGKAADEDAQALPLHVVTTSSIVSGEQEASDVIAITYTVKLA